MQRLRTIFASFFKIGLFTFGGGYAMLPSQMENLHWNSPYHEGFEKTLADKTVRNWIGLIPRAFDDWFFGEYEKKLENMILLLEGRYGKSEHGDDGASGQ